MIASRITITFYEELLRRLDHLVKKDLVQAATGRLWYPRHSKCRDAFCQHDAYSSYTGKWTEAGIGGTRISITGY